MLGVRVRITETLGDIDPVNTGAFERAGSRVKKGPPEGVSLILPTVEAQKLETQ